MYWLTIYLEPFSGMEYSDNKSQKDARFLNFILVKTSTCFEQTYCPSSGVSTLYTQQQVFVMQVMFTVCQRPRQQTVNITGMTNSNCCEYSIKTPGDGQYVCPKHVELVFIIRLHHDARSSECQVLEWKFSVDKITKKIFQGPSRFRTDSPPPKQAAPH